MIENQKPESIWILAPLLFLVKIGVPSLYLLYMADPVVNSYLRLNINAQQWFWRYGYSGFCPSNMSSPLVIGVSTAPQLKIEEGIIIILNGYTPTISTGGGRFSVWIRVSPINLLSHQSLGLLSLSLLFIRLLIYLPLTLQ